MTSDPRIDPDPQPGDFDAELAKIEPSDVEVHVGDSEAGLTIGDGTADESDENESE